MTRGTYDKEIMTNRYEERPTTYNAIAMEEGMRKKEEH